MKIAIPTKMDDAGRSLVDDHFGHCEYYTILTVDENGKDITVQEQVAAPKGCGCKSNAAGMLAGEDVTVLLGGNMGQGALNKLNESGIKVIRGVSGDIREAADKFLAGEIIDQPDLCENHHGDGDHNCGHHLEPNTVLKPL